MNKAFASALTILAVAGAAGGGYWYGVKQGPGAKQAAAPAAGPIGQPGRGPGGAGAPGGGGGPAPVAVKMSRVEATALPQTITAVGSLRSDESVTLRPEVAGRITEIRFQEGQPVVKGMPLVRLDPTINQAEVRQARANLTLAKAKYERSADLAGRNFISGQAKDEARNNLEIAASTVALAEARLAKLEIRAPFSGIIGLRSVSVGDYVAPGTDLVKLEAIDPLKVDFRVPEVFLRDVQAGQPVEVSLDALPGKVYDGKVFALDPLVDAAGRSLVIRAQVRNQDAAMRPGMFARVRLITRVDKDAMILPEEALVPQGSEQFVFKVVDSRVSRVKVETGQRRDGKVEIVSGLGKDDLVVTAGQAKLREGATVRAEGAGTGGPRPSGPGGANGAAAADPVPATPATPAVASAAR